MNEGFLITEHELGERLGKQRLANTRRADVTEDRGWVVLEIEGDLEEIERGLEFAAAKGVRVDPVEGDVVEG